MTQRVPISEARLVELRAMPYHASITSPEWNRRRQVALSIAEYRCQLCNSPDELTVHHRSYENLGEEKYADLIVLCWPCHRLFHEHRRLVREPVLVGNVR